jgi:hypothetical protein
MKKVNRQVSIATRILEPVQWKSIKKPFQGYGSEPVANKKVISGWGRFSTFLKDVRRVIRVHQKPGSRFNEINMDLQHCSGREMGIRDFRQKELFINDPALSLKQNQCCGTVTFWCGSGSGSADPCLWQMDPDPAIFVIDLPGVNIKLIFYYLSFLLIIF